jgi:hypothetical protein
MQRESVDPCSVGAQCGGLLGCFGFRLPTSTRYTLRLNLEPSLNDEFILYLEFGIFDIYFESLSIDLVDNLQSKSVILAKGKAFCIQLRLIRICQLSHPPARLLALTPTLTSATASL